MTGRWPFGVPQRSDTSLQIMHVQQAVFLLPSRPLRLGVPFSVVVSAYEV